MDYQHLTRPAGVATAILVVLVIVGVPIGTLAVLLLVLACPLMMFFMMRGTDHTSLTHDSTDEEPRAPHDHR